MEVIVEKIVAIHQPNFLPWLGFFHKWRRADHFVWLDEVQLVRRTYLSRATFLEREKVGTISVPVVHTGSQETKIREAQIDTSQWQPNKVIKRLRFAYGKLPHWENLEKSLADIMTNTAHCTLLDLNVALLFWIGEDILQLDRSKIILQSNLVTKEAKSALMAEITALVGGTVYLSGGKAPAEGEENGVGAAAYNHPADFEKRDLRLEYQNFVPVPYPQGRHPFVQGLSALDVIAHLGPKNAREHLYHY